MLKGANMDCAIVLVSLDGRVCYSLTVFAIFVLFTNIKVACLDKDKRHLFVAFKIPPFVAYQLPQVAYENINKYIKDQ